MPMHDWTKVPGGIFHAFHHEPTYQTAFAVMPRRWRDVLQARTPV